MNSLDLFNELYENYNKLVYRIAYKYKADPNFAEDSVQNVFLLISKKVYLFENIDENHKKNLLCTIARGVIIDSLRSENKTPIENIDVINDYEYSTKSDIDIIKKSTWEDIKAAMNQSLSDREKDIIALKFVHGLSNNEIAEIYNIKKAWTSQLISAALRKIKKTLGDNYICD